ncbi:MAG TPA: NfeD family protein [Proteiniphilum sp.]|nr:NfeD family protein [Proteiniphilum sp.]HPJ50664.1 NfeD family protein [Proteiniphilum sp.]HPR20011.1 NfeD family protein [Proteiniphilum sp.]
MTFELMIVVALILVGILFMLAEIFLLPGISVAGIAGAIFLIGGIVYSYLFIGSTAGNITLATSAIAMGASFFLLLKSKSLRRISLETNIESKVDNSDLAKIIVGDTGIALSRLNPTGKVMVNELIVEGKSYNGEFIDEDEKIEVIRIDTYQIQVVRKTETERV